jgi:hypothetical protein
MEKNLTTEARRRIGRSGHRVDRRNRKNKTLTTKDTKEHKGGWAIQKARLYPDDTDGKKIARTANIAKDRRD